MSVFSVSSDDLELLDLPAEIQSNRSYKFDSLNEGPEGVTGMDIPQ